MHLPGQNSTLVLFRFFPSREADLFRFLAAAEQRSDHQVWPSASGNTTAAMDGGLELHHVVALRRRRNHHHDDGLQCIHGTSVFLYMPFSAPDLALSAAIQVSGGSSTS